VIAMRRLAILFAILVAVSTFEHVVLSRPGAGVTQGPGRIRRALIRLSDWRVFLIGPIRLFQRTTSHGSGPWLGLSN
jgi:hypothetical protein